MFNLNEAFDKLRRKVSCICIDLCSILESHNNIANFYKNDYLLLLLYYAFV